MSRIFKISCEDLAFRNLRFIAEVEPNEVKKETEGERQLDEYAKLVLERTGYGSVVGALIWGVDESGREWDAEVYEYSKDGKKLLGKGKEVLIDVVSKTPKNKLPLTTFNFLLLFSPIRDIFYERIRELLDKYESDESIRPLISAYKNALDLIYGGVEPLSDDKIKELFTIHTLIQITANAVLSYVLLGRIDDLESLTGKYKPYSVSLPFLEWIYELYERGKLEERETLEELLKELRRRILAFDWSEKSQDIFRLLYEEFINEEDRRVFGEYYTPLWLVRFMLREVGDLRGKVILDPFCGSGTFLDEGLRKKVEEGEDPEFAINSVIGFDVNPVAVMLARAELLLTYRNLSKSKDFPTPLVFYVNSAEVFSGTRRIGKLFTQGDKKKPVFLYHVRELTEVFNPSIFEHSAADFSTLREFESALKYILEETYRDLKEGRSAEAKLKKLIDRFSGGRLGVYFKALKPDRLHELLEKYGDGVWAVSISSLFAVSILKNKKVDLCISNPPWIHLTEVRGEYGELLRSMAKKLLRKEDPREAVQGGNVASVFLQGFSEMSDVLFFVLPDSVVTEGGVHGVGKLITFRAVEKRPHRIYRVLYDAFTHGEKPALVLVGEGGGEIIEVKPEERAYKDTRSVRLRTDKLQRTFGEHIEKLLSYFHEDVRELAKRLCVERIYKKGSYIMGLFGGERRKGKELYAGLVIEEMVEVFPLKVRLYNTESFAEIYEEEYVKEIVYIGRIFPFYGETLKCILSEKGEDSLKGFLERFKERVSPKDREKISGLIRGVRQGGLIELSSNRWYLVYRGKRVFTGFVIKGKKNLVLDSSAGGVEIASGEIAFYYAGALNFLAYKAIEYDRQLIRNQYARPLSALTSAGLEWRAEDWQYEVSELSRVLHGKSKALYEDVQTNQVKAYLKALQDVREWRDLKKLMDEHVRDLESALELVSE